MRRGQPVHDLTAPVEDREVTDAVSSPFLLAPGHPMRRLRCAICASMVGGREVRAASITIWAGPGCDCGAVPTLVQLICAEHGDRPDPAWVPIALARWHAHHSAVQL